MALTTKIPVAIWDGDCVIDFQEISDYIHFVYENDPDGTR